MAFGALPDDYAGPTLRLGLWFDDHIGGKIDFAHGKVSDFDPSIPNSWGGDLEAIACTLTAADGERWVGWKEIPAMVQTKQGPRPQPKNPEEFAGFQTKALGRALKRAGYPDGTGDLAELLRWRLVKKQIEVGNGEAAVAALTAAPGPTADARLQNPGPARQLPQGQAPRQQAQGHAPRQASQAQAAIPAQATVVAATDEPAVTLAELLGSPLFVDLNESSLEAIREKCVEWGYEPDDMLSPAGARKVLAFGQSVLNRQNRGE